jgi:hypothetical protein
MSKRNDNSDFLSKTYLVCVGKIEPVTSPLTDHYCDYLDLGDGTHFKVCKYKWDPAVSRQTFTDFPNVI